MAAGESLGLEGVVERGMEINPQMDADAVGMVPAESWMARNGAGRRNEAGFWSPCFPIIVKTVVRWSN
jgi:hypothetical protein